MKLIFKSAWLATAVCAVGTLSLSAAPPEATNTLPVQPRSPALGEVSPRAEQTAGGSAVLSNGVSEILQMIDAGVSKDVIEAFIDSSPVAYELSAADVIALKQRGVGDNITVALLKHGTKLRAERAEANAKAVAGASVAVPNAQPAQRVYAGGLDPESYQYFQYYYLHPRTLASVYQRLGMYGSPYPNGLYQPFPGYLRPGLSVLPAPTLP